MINKDTKIYGSFSKKAGNLGTKLFNLAFEYHNINAIYRSFSIDDIQDAFDAAKTLGFSGFAVSMPFKKEILNYVDNISDEVIYINSANTVIYREGKWWAYNTDYIAALHMIQKYKPKKVYILGNGGYAAAVCHAVTMSNLDFDIITRKNWNDIIDLKNKFIFNCTPVENLNETHIHESNDFVDCITTTETGKMLSVIQASEQFRLYTGKPFPFKSIV